MNETHPLDRAGVRSEIMLALGVSQQVVTNWKTREVPIKHCLTIEIATHGKVTRQELRPADWRLVWPELAQAQTVQGVSHV